jgi:hypothetical protein
MSLSKKYGIPEDKIKALVKDGWINCNLTRDEQIVYTYRKAIQDGKPHKQAITDAAEIGRLQERQVYNIIHKFD